MTADQSQDSVSNAGLWGSFGVLGLGYALLIAAPHALEQLKTLRGGAAGGAGWLPAAAAAGLALGGGAAMVFVLARLVRDVERRPYACFAPVLAVFAGFVLAGLHAELPLASVSSEYVGVFGLALSVVGGALVLQRAWTTRLAGFFIAILPPTTITAILWMHAQESSLGAMLVALDSQVRVYLVLLAVCSVSMVIVAMASRALISQREGSARGFGSPAIGPSEGGWAHGATPDGTYDAPVRMPASHGYAGNASSMLFQGGPTAAPAFDLAAEAWGAYLDEPAQARRRSPWLWGAAITALVAAAAFAVYYFHLRPQQQQERAAQVRAAAAAEAAQQRVKAAQAAEQSAQAAAAEERLRDLVESEPQGPAPEGPAVGAAAAAGQAEDAEGAEPAPALGEGEAQGAVKAEPSPTSRRAAMRAAKRAKKKAAIAAARSKRQRRTAAARQARLAARQAQVEAQAKAAAAAEPASPAAPKRAARAKPADSSSLAVQVAGKIGTRTADQKAPEEALLEELSGDEPDHKPGKKKGAVGSADDPLFGL